MIESSIVSSLEQKGLNKLGRQHLGRISGSRSPDVKCTVMHNSVMHSCIFLAFSRLCRDNLFTELSVLITAEGTWIVLSAIPCCRIPSWDRAWNRVEIGPLCPVLSAVFYETEHGTWLKLGPFLCPVLSAVFHETEHGTWLKLYHFVCPVLSAVLLFKLLLLLSWPICGAKRGQQADIM